MDAVEPKKPDRRWTRHIWIATGIFLFFEVGARFAMYKPPRGRLFDLEPDGWGMIWSYLTSAVVITGFYLFYTSVARIVRPSIGYALKASMFGGFVLFLGYLQAHKAVAVVRVNSTFIFISRWPFGQRTVPDAALPEVFLDNTPYVRSISLRGTDKNGLADNIDCLQVWHGDIRGSRTLDDLFRTLNDARLTALSGIGDHRRVDVLSPTTTPKGDSP